MLKFAKGAHGEPPVLVATMIIWLWGPFLAVQDSSIGDLVTDSLTDHSLTDH